MYPHAENHSLPTVHSLCGIPVLAALARVHTVIPKHQIVRLRNNYDDDESQHLVSCGGLFPVAIFITVGPRSAKQRYSVSHAKTFQNRFGSDW